jgi:UDP-N-acetylglucosamine diphosphorylase/glucosamine-1-phosphate N-acetyltransferase
MIAVIVMAAGKGTRMNSDSPKVMHHVGGQPLIEHVLAAARELHPNRLIVIVGHQREKVKASIQAPDVEFAIQEPQLGTGHAVLQAKPLLNDFAGEIVILSGDVPLLRAKTLQRLIHQHRSKRAAATVLSTTCPDPTGYGRIVRDIQGGFTQIIEEREASSDVKHIREINSGIYCFNSNDLLPALEELRTDNSKGEYYLTDVIRFLKDRGEIVQAVNIADFEEVRGINTIHELADAEAAFRQAKALG